jgi:hypothetical protein
MAHVVPIWCMKLLYDIIHLPYGYIWLPYGAHCSRTVPDPMWPQCSGCRSHMLPSASHMAHTTPIWPCVVNVAPVWLTRSHRVHGPPMWQHTPPIWLHPAPIWHMWLPYSTHHFHMQLPYGAINLPYGTIWLPHGSHMAHMAPTWSTWLPHGPHAVHVAAIWHHLPAIWCT